MLHVPASIGDAVDRRSILEIKMTRIRDDPAKIEHVRCEHRALCAALAPHEPALAPLANIVDRLKAVNETLWDVEDHLRLKESRGEFDDDFVRHARRVYMENDARAALKREINIATGSALVEVKSYGGHGSEKKVLMIPHMGLGDALILRGMVARLLESGAGEVVFACKRQYAAALSKNLFADLGGAVTLLPVDTDADISPMFGADGAVLRAYVDRGYAPLLIGLHHPSRRFSERPEIVFATRFYEDVGMDPGISHTHFGCVRDAEAEDDLYARVVAKHGPEYVVLHRDLARGFDVDASLLPTNVPIYDVHDPEVMATNIFDYCKVLEKARAIHAMDSCFALLADRLSGVTCPIVCHAYARDNSTLPGLYRKPVMLWYRNSGGQYELRQA